VILSSAGLQRINPGDTAGSEEQTKAERANIYLTVVLWSVAALSGFKFIGAVWFLIVRMFRGV
jgi:chitin synthase